jgi:ribosomal protein S12 methylthiotransferase accessory factor
VSGLAAALGVTRIARLTGLDRTGVEVASAVRPAGHVLQVTNGKGASFAEAARGALCEAAELWAAERPGELAHARAGAAEVRARVAPEVLVLSRADLDGEGDRDPDQDPGDDGLRGGWREARALEDGRPALVPADAVHCPPGVGDAPPAWARWTSNGMGAHPDRAAALLHGLLEAVERDRLARALPEGFTEREIAARLLDPQTLVRAAPRTAALRAALEGRGFRVHLLDVTSGERSRASTSRRAEDLGLPVAAAVLVDEEGGPVPVSAGYACRRSRDAALAAALLEAAQSRATEIHGAREDVAVGDRAAARPLAALLAGARPRRSAAALPEARTAALSDARAAAPAAAVRDVARRLRRAGFDRAVVVDLAAPAGLHVVKVLVPGLLVSGLLL